jgi:phosphate acetyltransferase
MRDVPAVATAVAHPCDGPSLRGALEAAEAGMIVPILVGPRHRIEGVAASEGLDISGFELVEAPHSHAAAMAVELVRAGRADLLMKGSLHTDELLAAVTRKETGLRSSA